MLALRRTAPVVGPAPSGVVRESRSGARVPARRRVIALACGLASLSMAAALPAPARAQERPVGDAPTLHVGDEWRWTGGRSRRVVAVEGALIVTQLSTKRCPKCLAYRDRNLTVVKVVDPEGKVVSDPAVGYKMLDFPLATGKTWESDQVLVNLTTRAAEPYRNSFAVEGYEEVKTKAGAFKAFRISHVQERTHTSVGLDAGRSRRETLWYSPEVGAFVKREANTAGVKWGPDWELETYRLAPRPVASSAPPLAGAAPAAPATSPGPRPRTAAPQRPPPDGEAWPDLSKAEPGLSQSPVSVVMWSVDIERPGPDVPPDKARWSGKWAGWACRSQECDARLIVEKVTPAGASIIYGFASKRVKPVTARLDAKFVGERLEATFRDGARVAYRMRPEGDIEVYYRKGSAWYGGVLSKEKQ
jgi:hypothetical protein